MDHLFATVIFGLGASLCWGGGDFSGGLGLPPRQPIPRSWRLYGGVCLDGRAGSDLARTLSPGPALGRAGRCGGRAGLLAFYSALSSGKMGITAPVSAVLTAALPVLFSAITTGLPTLLQLGGFLLALLAIGLISRPERTQGPPKGIWLAVLAGCAFGCFFILISRVQPTRRFWPLAAARFTSVLVCW